MFGFEQEKKEALQPTAFGFAMEEQMLSENKYAEKLSTHIDGKVRKIKDLLRAGEKKQDFDRIATILNGYISLQKVVKRVEAQQMLKKQHRRTV